jgi:hypothetical protein
VHGLSNLGLGLMIGILGATFMVGALVALVVVLYVGDRFAQ